MQIISISRGSQSLGVEFAKALASKLGYECVSREDLLEEATRRKIPIGKLETAIVKPHISTERLANELEHYKALATSILCEKALDHNIVYHGRTGHLLLRGVDNILKIRVVGDMEYRIESVVNRLQLTPRKARQYIEAVEDDRKRWVKNFYNVDWDEDTQYDVVLNLTQLSSGNAATAACSLAQLPEFRSTPASINAVRDLLLAAKARLALAENEKTRNLNVKIMANKGAVYITYSFQQAKRLDDITDVLKDVPDVRQVVCTEAQINILWIQEEFDPDKAYYNEVLSLANGWDAAIEIMKMTPGQELKRFPVQDDIARRGLETWRQTGIIGEEDEIAYHEPPDVTKVYEKLINDGRAGGKRVLEGTLKNLLNTMDRAAQYRLIIFDNIFLSKSPDARKRLIQEWSNTISDSLKTPVVSLKELQAQYRFGLKQVTQLGILAAIVALLLFAIFQYEDPIMAFLLREGTMSRIISAACIAVFVPAFAFLYSSVTGLLLRAIHLD